MVWEEIIHTSNLAHSISALYASLLHSKVCLLDLNARQEIAFHIKAIHQISSLPELGTHPFHERNIPLLSTAHGFGESEEQADQVLAPKYTLLLLDEPAEILKKVPTRPAHRRKNWEKFVNGIKPTITYPPPPPPPPTSSSRIGADWGGSAASHETTNFRSPSS
jgi:hypothetical protein